VGHVTIHNLDDATLEQLRSRADRHGRSLEEELREIVRQATGPRLSKEEQLALIDSIRAMTPPGPRPLAEDLIRQDRDSH